MSSTLYTCPLPAEIPDISAEACIEDFGQIQKLSFQRQFASAGVKNAFVTATSDIKLKASWDAVLAAVDDTKAQVTPEVETPNIEAGAARTVGGGNATLGGITKNIGKETSTATFVLNAYKQTIIKELKQYEQETTLGVFLFNEHGQIGCIADDPVTPTEYYPIPIAKRTMFVGDKVIPGLEAEDSNAMTWQFYANWSDNFVVVSPTDFNPLTDLVNP